MKIVEVDIIYGQGVDTVGEVLDLATEAGYFLKSGSWFSYNGERIAQGRDGAKTWLKENPTVAKKLTEMIAEKAKKDRLAHIIDVPVVDVEEEPLDDKEF